MAKVIAYEYEVKGIRQVISNQDQLKKAVKETNAELGQIDKGTEQYKKLDKQLALLKNAQQDVRDENKKTRLELIAAAEKGKDSYRGLNAELKLLERQFQSMSKEARKTADGLQVADRLKEIRKELKGINEEQGKTGIGGALSDALGDLAGFDVAKFASISGAISLGAEAAGQAIQFVGELIPRLNSLRNSVELITGETGESLDQITSRIVGIADTFGESEDEILNAATSVANQLNISFDEALDRIQEGFIAGSNINGEFLDQLREYPTFFAEAGLSADSFFKIANRQATEGIFSDKGIDAVKEATIRLRELPQVTQDALQGIGITAEEISTIIDQEGIGGAIAKVSERLGELEADSPQVGAAIADIFGGAGEDAGLSFLTSLQDINDETQSLLDTTTEYQEQQIRTLEINTEFAEVQNEVAKALGGTGATMQNISTQVQSGLLQILLFLVERFQLLWELLQPVGEAFVNLGKSLGLVNESGERTQRFMNVLNGILEAQQFLWSLVSAALTDAINGFTLIAGKVVEFLEWVGVLDEDTRKAAEATSDMAEATAEGAEAQEKQTDALQKSDAQVKKSTTSLQGFTKSAKEAAEVTDKFAEGSISRLRKNLQELQQELDQVAPDDQEAILVKLLGAEAALEQAETLQRKLRASFNEIDPIQPLPTIQQTGQLVTDMVREISDIIEVSTPEIQKITIDQVKERTEEILGFINQANQFAQEASALRTQSELQQVEERYAAEIEAAEGNEARQSELQEQLAAERERIEDEAFERQKKFQIAGVLSSLASGIVNILAAPTVIPDPFGTVFKAGRIAFLAGTSLAQIANINKAQAAYGKLVEGELRGDTHSSPGGGIPMSVNGQAVIAEHGERVQKDEFGGVAIINKRSSAANRRALTASAGKTWAGKKAWLSAINSQNNWGVHFAQQGASITPNLNAIQPGPAGGSAPILVVSDVSSESADALAQKVSAAVEEATFNAIISAAGETNRIAEREERLRDRTGV